jgi:DNA segregation ATPase FtsK/SpoIIIE, S-DNA-T family
MASYQARQRDPLLDQNMQAMLERRGRELFGLALIGLALAFAALLWSYSPEDPGWMVATDEPAKNLLGRFGAAVASTLMIIGGKGTWGIPLVLLAWGLRFVSHRGADRALGRVVFAVITVALASIYVSTLVPDADWPHSFGLGGLFGDTILGALLGMLPGSSVWGLKLISVLSGLGLVGMGLFVTGFDLSEIKAIGRFLLVGLIMTYQNILTLAGRGAEGTVRAAAAMKDRQSSRREARTEAAREAAHAASLTMTPAPLSGAGPAALTTSRTGLRRPLIAVEPRVTADPGPATDQAWGMPEALRAEPRLTEVPAPRLGLLARMTMKRRPADAPEAEIELIEAESPTEDRIRARINDVIRSRLRQTQPGQSPITAAVQRREPPVVGRPRGPVPLVADTTRLPMVPAQPLVTAIAAQAFVPVPGIEAVMADGDEDDDAVNWLADDQDDEVVPAAPRAPLMADRRPIVQQASKKAPAPSSRAVAEAQPRLRFDEPVPAYELPPLSLLSSPVTVQRTQLSHEALEENARMLESVLDDYGVKGEIVAVRPGPVVTMYELEPAPGLKASRVIGLADDIARSMSALSARVSTVPGRSVIGIELPNAVREKVVLREILAARDFGDSNMRLPLALGKDIAGEPIVANLAKMPHLLIAGTTGSGKSVAINTMILSLLYKLSPEECRLIMIDPKMLELSVYDGIPHLLSPVVTDPKKAVVALKWVVSEMEERYRKMSKMGVRNIEGYNGRVREALANSEMFKRTIQTGFDDETGEPVFETDEFQPVALPYIVVIVDEMADLMMVAGKEIEACIQRLAQMARASGIHLIMATQRPSVDVITGTIKANFPTRISFQVTSKIDSRTILGEQGAEQLLGMGDMLYMAGGAKISRIHGPFVSDEEVEEIVTHLKSYGPPVYMSGVIEGVDEETASDIDQVLGLSTGEGDDALYDQAVAIVAKDRKCSTSYIQRKLGIGYNKAARLVEQMEDQGVVTPANHVGKREILIEER